MRIRGAPPGGGWGQLLSRPCHSGKWRLSSLEVGGLGYRAALPAFGGPGSQANSCGLRWQSGDEGRDPGLSGGAPSARALEALPRPAFYWKGDCQHSAPVAQPLVRPGLCGEAELGQLGPDIRVVGPPDPR